MSILFPGVAYSLSSDERVFTNPNDLSSDSNVTNEITLQGTGNLTCQTHKIYLKVGEEAWYVHAAMSEFVSITSIGK